MVSAQAAYSRRSFPNVDCRGLREEEEYLNTRRDNSLLRGYELGIVAA